jgi:ABC-type branched-subunit amino acid transport system ATPase component
MRAACASTDAQISGLRPDLVCDAGIGRTFQIVKPFAGLRVLDNVTVGALHRRPAAEARAYAADILDAARPGHHRATRPRLASPCRTASASKSRAPSPPSQSCCCSTR